MLQRVWRNRNPPHYWWECKLVQPLWRAVWRFLIKLKIELLYDPAIPLLGMYPEKIIIQKDTCTPMFTVALFTIAKTWNMKVLVAQSCRTLWSHVGCQAPLSTEFSRQEYWSGLPFPSPGDLPDPGIEPTFPASQADSLPSEPPGKPQSRHGNNLNVQR